MILYDIETVCGSDVRVLLKIDESGVWQEAQNFNNKKSG